MDKTDKPEAEDLTEQDVNEMRKNPKVMKLLQALLKESVEGGNVEKQKTKRSKHKSKSKGNDVIKPKGPVISKIKSPSYWVPAEKDNRITGIRKWDQAFRIYVAIYCKTNPSRSHEIWQYIYIINTAASSYNWENVAYYDFTFQTINE